MNNEKDKKDCFAWISEKLCNALNVKNCKNCRFYKNKSEVSNYSQYLQKGKKEVLGKEKKYD